MGLFWRCVERAKDPIDQAGPLPLGGMWTARLRTLGQAFAGKQATKSDQVKSASAGAFAGRLWKRHDHLANTFIVHREKTEHLSPP